MTDARSRSAVLYENVSLIKRLLISFFQFVVYGNLPIAPSPGPVRRYRAMRGRRFADALHDHPPSKRRFFTRSSAGA